MYLLVYTTLQTRYAIGQQKSEDPGVQMRSDPQGITLFPAFISFGRDGIAIWQLGWEFISVAAQQTSRLVEESSVIEVILVQPQSQSHQLL